jgi:hypothetical protein
VAAVASYLVLVEVVKRIFYRVSAARARRG